MTTLDALTEDFARQFPAEFAATLGSEPAETVLEVLGNLPASLVIPIAARLPQSHFLEFSLRDVKRLRSWLSATDIDQALMFIGRMSRHQAIGLIEGVENPKLARRLMRASRTPEHSVGPV